MKAGMLAVLVFVLAACQPGPDGIPVATEMPTPTMPETAAWLPTATLIQTPAATSTRTSIRTPTAIHTPTPTSLTIPIVNLNLMVNEGGK